MDNMSLERAFCSLFCEQCHEFINLRKWHPIKPVALGATPFALSKVDFSGDAFPELVCCFKSFVESHKGHQLFLYFSGGDCPWYSDELNWYIWKQTTSPFFHPSVTCSDVDLPRNIIDDLGITNWTDALMYYRKMCPCVEYPERLESVFYSMIANKA